MQVINSTLKTLSFFAASMVMMVNSSANGQYAQDLSVDEFLMPQRGLLQAQEDIDEYFLLLRRKLIVDDSSMTIASALWTSAIGRARALQITRDYSTGVYTLIGTYEKSSTWRSYSYWKDAKDPVLKKIMDNAGNAPPLPEDIEVAGCKVELPAISAQRLFWLWDTALLNTKYVADPKVFNETSVQYLISTVERSGQMVSPKVESTNGKISLLLLALNDLCWIEYNHQTLSALNQRLDDLRESLRAPRYAKGSAWSRIKATDFANQMTVHEQMVSIEMTE